MTNQQFTIAELGARFGGQMAQALSELIVLEKMTEAQREQIREITEDKTNLQNHIHDLENELALLKSEIYELQHELQRAQNTLSPEAEEIKTQGREIIANENEKAAQTEAA